MKPLFLFLGSILTILVSLLSFFAGRASARPTVQTQTRQELAEAITSQPVQQLRIGMTNLRLLESGDMPKAIGYNCMITGLGLDSAKRLSGPLPDQQALRELIEDAEGTHLRMCGTAGDAPESSFAPKPLRDPA